MNLAREVSAPGRFGVVRFEISISGLEICRQTFSVAENFVQAYLWYCGGGKLPEESTRCISCDMSDYIWPNRVEQK